MKNKIILSGLLFAFFHLTLFGQVEFKKLSPKKMKKDYKVFLKTLDAHPDPYTKTSKEDFNKIVEEVEQNISTELDQIDFYKNLARTIASFRDGHSSVYMPKNWLTSIRKKHGVFPYEVFLSDDNELFLIKTYAEDQPPLGMKILSINDMPVEEFVETVSPYISYETIPFRNDKISRSFEFLLYVVFKQVDQLTLKFESSELKISNMKYNDWYWQKKDLREEREKRISIGEPYDFEIIKPGIAKIDIFSFAVPDAERYRIFLDKIFKKIKKNDVHSIIIDVRGNYGGYPKVASQLFHYIHEGHFKTMAKSSMKVSFPYRSYYTDRYPGIQSSTYRFPQRRHFVDLESIIRGKLGSYIDEAAFFNEQPKTEKHEFQGKCYVLIDRKSYSASSAFASTFQCYNMGLLIGEPTGGTKIFRANAFPKELQRTKFTVRVSTAKKFTACFNQENEPVIPNLEVKPSILDRVHNIDSQLNTTLRVIKKMEKEKAKQGK